MILKLKNKESNIQKELVDDGKMGSQPPKNKIAEKVLIINMFAYSAKKNNANVIAEYSTL